MILRTCRPQAHRILSLTTPLLRQPVAYSLPLRRPFSSSRTSFVPPIKAYDSQVESGLIQSDDHQRSIVTLLDTLYAQLDTYQPASIPEPLAEISSPSGIFSFFRSAPKSPIPPIDKSVPKGLYLYGSVGCGKSFLMDLFYANLPDRFENDKRRVHFHQFMMDVHQRGHRMKDKLGDRGDWVVHVARDLAREARVLCFDEFQVTDIADAMILRRLMESLVGYGVVSIMTSNRAPDELYKNGIQREQFIPCIELIKDRFVVKCLDSDIDYRKRPRALSKVYFHPITPAHELEMDKLFDAATAHEEPVSNRNLTVWGRQLSIPLSTSHVAQFTFQELCGHPLSASDYLEITKKFKTVFVRDVPKLGLSEKDMARRFILFIDAAYEARTKIFILSESPISEIFSDERKDPGEISAHQRSIMDDLGLSAETVGASSMFTGDEEVFAFARAVSRITEMGGTRWARENNAVEQEGEKKVT